MGPEKACESKISYFYNGKPVKVGPLPELEVVDEEFNCGLSFSFDAEPLLEFWNELQLNLMKLKLNLALYKLLQKRTLRNL